MAVPISHLMQDQSPLVFVAPGDSLLEAIGKMTEHDFSQLPVLENGFPYGKPASFVTSTSIARALRVFGASLDRLRVRDAVVPARTVSSDEDLFASVDDLMEAYAVLVLNPDGTPFGIVTNYDTTQYFRRRAEDMLLVEDIETTLRDHIRAVYGGDEGDPEGPLQTAINSLGSSTDNLRDTFRKSFRRFCGVRNIPLSDGDLAEVVERPFASSRSERSFDKLTLYEYTELACRAEAWEKLEPLFGVSRDAFRTMLDGVRETRNKLMHFRADVDALERDRLRFCAEWFKHYPPLNVAEDNASEPAPVRETEIAGGEVRVESGEYDEDAAAESELGLASSDIAESKYAPLARYLLSLPRTLDRVELSFEEVETIIGAKLPAAARDHRAWWANDTTAHVQSVHWLEVGWRVISINMTKERVVFARARDRERAYIRFFSTVQNRLKEKGEFPLATLSPLGQNWIPLVNYSGTGVTLVLGFARRQRLRLECYIDTGDATKNEQLFERLLAQRDAFEAVVGSKLEWEPLEQRRACRIAMYAPGSITDPADDLESLIGWVVENAPRMHRALTELLP